ncbi:MAG TPA: 16S rRNA (adenine(1518)-N(6)/adenine(1519)-N(6))-dimethyltransferase [Ruminococcaceae bacterium]|nr:16S rRNA (adenine(1518)-N(6)/adenine(1519)-N(6))-dimethyltransferase [Oscillospiraceae bacterium]
MNLADINTVRSLLAKNGFTFKKSLGQNFLINPDVCPAMANAACDSETGVIEIGPGIGVLTRELAKTAKKVIAIELDERLKKILPETLSGLDNVEVIYGDALKLDLNEIIKEKLSCCKSVAVCANLPYYITSPVIMNLLESRLPITSVTVMVQKEAAQRLCAEVGTREAGAVSVAVSYYAEPHILFGVSRASFMPPPNVDSAVIKLKIRKEAPIKVKNEKEFFRLVKCCFSQRRKTLVNAVSNTAGTDKDELRAALRALGLPETVRGEQLTMEQLAALSDII